MATRISISRITIQATVERPAPTAINADLARPPDDTVCHDAVKTDARKDEREPRKERGQHEKQALVHERGLDRCDRADARDEPARDQGLRGFPD